MIKSIRFDALQPGPHLIVLGGVHGNELCGTQAVERLIQNLENQTLTLTRGRLTCVPLANPKARELGQRKYQRDLNRALYVKDNPQAYEDFINPILCDILSQADALIDLHSYASQGGAFSFMGVSSAAEIDFCRHLSVQDFVYGWGDAFAKTTADPRECLGTVDVARKHGAMATTVECGHHHNADAADVGYDVLVAGLAYLEMIDAPKAAPQQQRFVCMQSVYKQERAGQLVKPWQHYDAVKSGEVIARYNDGEEITAPEDGFLVLPKLHAAVGDEWFYFGVATDCPQA